MQNLDFQELFIVLPAYNEAPRIELCLEKIIKLGFKNIIVVNDASSDTTAKIANSYDEVLLLSHLINLGPGAATQTGIEYALMQNAKYIATIDADDQHDPKDLVHLYEKIKSENLDLLVGSRFLNKNSIPKLRIIYNKIGNFISFLLTQKLLSDSQSGIKILSADLARKIAIELNGFEFCMEIISTARKLGAKIDESPVSVTYSEETTRKGQNLASGLSMLSRVFSPFR